MATKPTKRAPRSQDGRAFRDEQMQRLNTTLPKPLYQKLMDEARSQRRTLAQQLAHELEACWASRGAA